jgi:serine protease AprX
MKPFQRLLKDIIIILLLLALTAPGLAPASAQSISRISPVINRFALESPDQPLQLIVQTTGTTSQVNDLVVHLGGKVIKDLHIIHAVVVVLPAKAASQLGANPFVKWVSLDAQVSQSDDPAPDPNQTFSTVTSDLSTFDPTSSSTTSMSLATGTSMATSTASTSSTTASFTFALLPINPYLYAIKATRLGYEGLKGQGVTVAVVDSGIAADSPDLASTSGGSRVIASVDFSQQDPNQKDSYGHGTHVAGIIGGNGAKSRGLFPGIAPKVNLVDVKVTDAAGKGNESDVISGLQWIYDNKSQYNIKVVNLSLNSSSPQPYQTSPLDAALEVLWFNQIVVVVSAGNNGSGANNGILYPPANDPFVITVGAVDDKHTLATADDAVASFSAYGTTESGFYKPDLVAPGTNVISILANADSTIAVEHPTHIFQTYYPNYFRMSGTSMSAAVTSGAVALLIQANPALNPDQVKYHLVSTARPFGPAAGAGYLDANAAVHTADMSTTNTGTPISQLISIGDGTEVSGTVMWNSVMWNSVMWNSVMWNSVMWNSVMWNSVMWNSDYWGD